MNWWPLLLLGLAAYRCYRLLAHDALLDIPRGRLLRLGDWKQGERVPAAYRARLGEFLVCPWCLGFWIALAWWIAWRAWPQGTLWIAFPFALSTIVGLLARLDDDE